MTAAAEVEISETSEEEEKDWETVFNETFSKPETNRKYRIPIMAWLKFKKDRKLKSRR
jgi:integrase